jgi:hypothetical protein
MTVPINPLYIDIPNIGTARVYVDINGDQYGKMSATWFQVDFRAVGNLEWTTIDETETLAKMGGWPSFPEFLENVLKNSGVTGYPPLGDYLSNTAAFVQWFLNKPRVEIDAMLAKWKKDILLPWLGKYLTEVLRPVMGAVSTPTGTYANAYEAINAQIPGAKVTISNGVVTLS